MENIRSCRDLQLCSQQGQIPCSFKVEAAAERNRAKENHRKCVMLLAKGCVSKEQEIWCAEHDDRPQATTATILMEGGLCL